MLSPNPQKTISYYKKLYGADTLEDIVNELKRFTGERIAAHKTEEFFNWIHENGWIPYDSCERWEKQKRVVLTVDLFTAYTAQNKTTCLPISLLP